MFQIPFNLFSLRSSLRKTLLSFFGFFFLYIIFFLTRFLQNPWTDFHEISGMVYIGLKRPKIIFRVMTSLPVRNIDDFLIFMVSFCLDIFSKTTQDIFFKFLQIVDNRLKFVPFDSQVSSSKSAEAR